MSPPVRPLALISLGETINIVSNPQPWDANVVAKEIRNLLEKLTDCGMRRTRIAARPLEGIELPYNLRTGFITPVAQEQLKAWMSSINQVLADEASEMKLVVFEEGIGSKELRQLETILKLNAVQQRLVKETIGCLERAAFGASIVIA